MDIDLEIDLTQVTPDEDALLRRLDYFERSGAVLAPELGRVARAIRVRDLRRAVRAPFDFVTTSSTRAPGPF